PAWSPTSTYTKSETGLISGRYAASHCRKTATPPERRCESHSHLPDPRSALGPSKSVELRHAWPPYAPKSSFRARRGSRNRHRESSLHGGLHVTTVVSARNVLVRSKSVAQLRLEQALIQREQTVEVFILRADPGAC